MRVLTAARSAAVVAAAVGAAYLACTSTSLGATRPLPPLTISAGLPTAAMPLDPGDSVRVRVTLTNNTAHPLDLDPGTIEGNVAHLPTACLASWFTFAVRAGPAVAVAGNGGTATLTGRLTFVEANTDQSACAGATLTLSVRLNRSRRPT
jgi:hypothetical protein